MIAADNGGNEEFIEEDTLTASSLFVDMTAFKQNSQATQTPKISAIDVQASVGDVRLGWIRVSTDKLIWNDMDARYGHLYHSFVLYFGNRFWDHQDLSENTGSH